MHLEIISDTFLFISIVLLTLSQTRSRCPSLPSRIQIFSKLVLATKSKANTSQLTKTGMATAQVCNFIGDSLLRRMLTRFQCLASMTFPTHTSFCESLLYSHLSPTKSLVANSAGGKDSDITESPATLLASLLSMDVERITENALVTSLGLVSLGGG